MKTLEYSPLDNGIRDTVSLSYKEYKRLKTRIDLSELLAQSDEDVKNGRVAPMKDTFEDLRSILKKK